MGRRVGAAAASRRSHASVAGVLSGSARARRCSAGPTRGSTTRRSPGSSPPSSTRRLARAIPGLDGGRQRPVRGPRPLPRRRRPEALARVAHRRAGGRLCRARRGRRAGRARGPARRGDARPRFRRRRRGDPPARPRRPRAVAGVAIGRARPGRLADRRGTRGADRPARRRPLAPRSSPATSPPAPSWTTRSRRGPRAASGSPPRAGPGRRPSPRSTPRRCPTPRPPTSPWATPWRRWTAAGSSRRSTPSPAARSGSAGSPRPSAPCRRRVRARPRRGRSSGVAARLVPLRRRRRDLSRPGQRHALSDRAGDGRPLPLGRRLRRPRRGRPDDGRARGRRPAGRRRAAAVRRRRGPGRRRRVARLGLAPPRGGGARRHEGAVGGPGADARPAQPPRRPAPPTPAPANADFEAPAVRLASARVGPEHRRLAGRGRLGRDRDRPRSSPRAAARCLRLDAEAPAASVASEPFAPAAHPSIVIHAWLRGERPDAKLRLWIEGQAAGRPFAAAARRRRPARVDGRRRAGLGPARLRPRIGPAPLRGADARPVLARRRLGHRPDA